MASKEEQAAKNLNMEKYEEENEGGEQTPSQKGEESRPLRKNEGQKSGGILGRVKRFVPSFRWAIPNKHTDHNEVKGGVEKFEGQMVEMKRKAKEQQLRHYLRFQTPEPDNHYDFCLIP